MSGVDPLLLITHADSGHADSLGTALEVLGEQASVEVCETSNPGELDSILHRAGSRPIVVAGGDGSLHAVIATLHRRNDLAGKTIGLLPMGTGNDFARAVGIPLDPTEAAEALLKSSPRAMDLIVDELGEVVVNGLRLRAGTGISSEPRSARRLLGYPLDLLGSLLGVRTFRLRVEVDGTAVTDVDRQLLSVAISVPDGGDAEVVLTFASGRLRALRPEIAVHRGTQVRLAGEEFWISADGEISGPERRRTWHVEPAAYSLLVT